MKLLYLNFRYTAACKRVFKDDVELNFDSEYTFALAGDCLNATCAPDERLSDGFFSTLPAKTGDEGVDSVSIVVGGNGVGKTALCDVLADLKDAAARETKFERYVLVYRLHGSDQVYCETNVAALQVPAFVVNVNAQQDDAAAGLPSFAALPLVYLSPNFTPSAEASTRTTCAAFTDLSAIGAMTPASDKFYDVRTGTFRTAATSNPIAAFCMEQVQHALAFASAAHDLPSAFSYPNDDDKLKMGARPEGVTIALGKAIAQAQAAASGISEDVQTILAKAQGGAGEFLANVFYAYAAALLIDDPVQEYGDFAQIAAENRTGDEYERMKSAWDGAQQYQKDVLAFCQKKSATAKTIANFFKNADAYPGASKAVEAKNFFVQLTAILKKDTTQQSATLASPDVSRTFSMDKVPCADVQELVALYVAAKRTTAFLAFDVSPRWASGEKSFFYTWGRTFHHYRESAAFVELQKQKVFDRNAPDTWPEAEDAIVYLDDAETTLHPEWQRQQVKRTIWFFEAFAPWVHPHVVFATHSPILLSDVPRGNVIKLARDDAGETIVESASGRNTFAANVFDLYRDAFFLDQGTMGAFAASKVNRLLKKLAQDQAAADAAEALTEDDLKTADLIGDPFLAHYVYRRLEDLAKNYDAPEDEQGTTAEGV